MKIGDNVTTKDNKTGVIVEVLDRYVMVNTGDLKPRAYIKREVKIKDI